MSNRQRARAWRMLVTAATAGAGGCHAGLGAAGGAAEPQAGAVLSASGFAVTERAEPGPITALAFGAAHLLAGSARGVRRWDVAADEFEWLTAASGRNVSALGVDGEGDAWVASDAGVGLLARDGDGLRYQPMGAPGRITLLAPLARSRAEGVWAGGPGGLQRLIGRAWTAVDALREVAITSLDLDRDGRAVWVGTRGRGLYRAGADRVEPILRAEELVAPGEPAVLAEMVGTALTAAGTRVAAARAGEGARLAVLSRDGIEVFRAQAEVRLVRLCDGNGDAVLVAGPAGAERAFSLRPLAKGEPPPEGGLRFVPLRRAAGGRWAAVPLPLLAPPRVTAVAAGGGALFFGTERMGVARADAVRPRYLAGAELVGDADRVTVACTTPGRCFVVTDGPRAWLTDGDAYAETRVGESDDGRVLAVAVDPGGAIYALSAEPKFAGLVITRRAPFAGDRSGEAPPGGAELWQPFLRVPLEMPVAGPPAVSLAAISPEGTLWVGVRVGGAAARDDSVGFGAVEIDLGTRHVVQHRPTRAGERPRAETLPLPPGLTGVLFDKPALWFSSMSGVSRWQQGELRSWGENEGMPSELAHGVAKGPDGKIWAATSEGLARFDGKDWRAAPGGGKEIAGVAGADGDGATTAARALVRDGSGRVWVATAKGLRVITVAGAPAMRPGATVVPGDMRDVVLDRLGRVWALSTASIALVDARAVP